MDIASLGLPQVITAHHGLTDRLHQLNQSMPMRHRCDGWYVEYAGDRGVVYNRKMPSLLLGQYVPFADGKYKFVKDKFPIHPSQKEVI